MEHPIDSRVVVAFMVLVLFMTMMHAVWALVSSIHEGHQLVVRVYQSLYSIGLSLFLAAVIARAVREELESLFSQLTVAAIACFLTAATLRGVFRSRFPS